MSPVDAPYPVVRVLEGAPREDETLGTKFKFWFVEGEPGHERRVLFKRGRTHEDWSEKVAAEVARLLGLPAAEVELAECDGRVGIASPSFLEAGEQLFHGNELLAGLSANYPQGDRYRVAEHTVSAVIGALEASEAARTPGWAAPWPDFDAVDQFVGYLLLDALIGNSDRHHENWAVVQRGGERWLAPTYDHASSLGRNETSARAGLRLSGRDPRVTVAAYADRCRSALYPAGSSRPLRPLEAFRAAGELRARAAEYWTARLAEVSIKALARVLKRVPAARISDTYRGLALALLEYNRGAILRAPTPPAESGRFLLTPASLSR